MGNLLKVLWKDYSAAESKDNSIYIDFEDAKPTIEEEPVCTEVGKVLTAGRCIITNIQGYAGATDDIRQAISNPRNEELQEKAWQAVCPLVAKLKSYYEFSGDLEKIIPRLLGVLCSNEKTPRQHLETQQALFKQFAEVLEFVFIFDEIKMTTPSIQNDFSYYRRTQNRSKMANEDDTGNESVVSNEVANRMSLFYAHATPMLKVLSDATTRFVSENKNLPVENTTDCLATMAKICRVMIDTPEYVERFQNSYDTKKFCLRVMVGVIILYDHVHPLGAFVRQSSIEMKSSIKVLKDQQPSEVEGLLNALRYTTKHLNDETTPKAIKTMLAV